MKKETAALEWKNSTLKVLDQTLLPFTKKYIVCRTYKETAKAIKNMKLRGAPLIGVAAAFGIAMEVKKSTAKDYKQLQKEMKTAAKALIDTRPTAVNLKWAVERMLAFAESNKERRFNSLKTMIVEEAVRIYKEDHENNKAIGKSGAELIRSKDRIITHCNAGALATAGHGTALGVIRSAAAAKKKVSVLVGETRPYLQGARLTAFELAEMGIPYEIITDNMAGHFISRGEADVVLVGADRIAANGDTVNKIGTYTLAVLSYMNHIPFYVAAPSSTIDFSIKNGKDIPIEERPEAEVLKINGKSTAPPKSKARHPAFDLTPARFISAIITEKGVIRAPFEENLEKTIIGKDIVAKL
ncbi:MAG: S-methyl-5-thioribose-1-phosphate isomerase [Candidatus Goldiibacteriota bacterium]